ncbi:MAG: DUF975 family protein, partial [Bacillota bacterium]|nr:DUF975 family protein [Bacillota bacterium]
VLTFFGVISGIGTQLTELSTSTVATDVENVEGDEAVVDMAPSYTPGLVKYLNDYADGSDRTEEVAGQVMSSFKGTGGILYNIMYKVDQFVFTHDTAAKVMVLIAIAAYLIYFIFIKNVLQVGFCRFLIETRVYSKTKLKRVFFVFGKGGILRTSYAMIMKALFIAMLLFFGILAGLVGVIIAAGANSWIPLVIGFAAAVYLVYLCVTQYYALMLVPFILSENPLMKRKEIFALSRQMMKGSKMHAFGLELSFIGWGILSLCTFGLLSIFFLTPYRYLARGELFMTLRNFAIDNNLEYSANLQDNYLTAPPASLIKSEGIQVTDDMDIFPLSYPAVVPFKRNWFIEHVQNLEPERKYALVTYILFFFIFSFLGWCWEVSIHLVKDGVFINRGTMFGPWLPIYGSGGVMIIFLLKRFAKKPALLFVCTMILCSIVEYFTSWFLEVTKGMEWWDYSGYFLNINGRICLEGALTFAIGGCMFVYLAGPFLDNLLSKVGMKPKVVACVVLVLLFGTDVFYSHFHPNAGKGITDYGYRYDDQKLYGTADIYKLPGLTARR